MHAPRRGQLCDTDDGMEGRVVKIEIAAHSAVQLFAELVEAGLTFEAKYDNDWVTITLTGGY